MQCIGHREKTSLQKDLRLFTLKKSYNDSLATWHVFSYFISRTVRQLKMKLEI
jgi:hypothetical protein